MASSSSSTARVQSVSIKLCSRDEYESWKEVMLGHLVSTSMAGYIDGKNPPPSPETDAQAHEDWKRIDRSVKDWILESLSEELVPTVVGRETSRQVWLQLETVFTQLIPSGTEHIEEGGYKRMPVALYKAAMRGDWEATKAILDQYPDAAEARVAPSLNAVLHVAVDTGRAIPYLQTLVNYVSDDILALKCGTGGTALDSAATIGNVAAARVLVQRRRDLLYATDVFGIFPVVKAAMSSDRPTIEFFMAETEDNWGPNPFDHDSGVLLLYTLITSDFFG